MNITLTDEGVLRLPEGLQTVPQELMSGCEALRAVEIPEGVRTVEAAAFAECTELTRVTLPSTLRTVCCGAFLCCASLKELRLPEGLEEIQESAFWGCGLRRVTVPASVRLIGECAFRENEHLTRADVLNPDAVLEQNVFHSCPRLTGGYIAPGYPTESSVDSSHFCQAERAAEELLYTLLWCSCPERHAPQTSARAERFIRANQNLILEWILRENNTAAMTTAAERKLLEPAAAERFLPSALAQHRTELAALLLRLRDGARPQEDEFLL